MSDTETKAGVRRPAKKEMQGRKLDLVRGYSINEIAALERIDPSDVGRSLQLAFLAPEIVEAIITGRQPINLTKQRLKRLTALPLAWDQQAQLL